MSKNTSNMETEKTFRTFVKVSFYVFDLKKKCKNLEMGRTPHLQKVLRLKRDVKSENSETNRFGPTGAGSAPRPGPTQDQGPGTRDQGPLSLKPNRKSNRRRPKRKSSIRPNASPLSKPRTESRGEGLGLDHALSFYFPFRV